VVVPVLLSTGLPRAPVTVELDDIQGTVLRYRPEPYYGTHVMRGLYFIFLSAKAMATLEFLQREWINDGNFTGMGEERDPIVGLQEERGTFTIPAKPVRRRIHNIETFNVLRGGEYFFMPSLSALKWLADLK
jgi:deferrochelatase/peroxidase EfeB